MNWPFPYSGIWASSELKNFPFLFTLLITREPFWQSFFFFFFFLGNLFGKRKWSEVAQSCPTPWTVTYKAPLSMGFSRQEYWSGLPFPSPGDLPWPRDWSQAPCIAVRHFTIWAIREAQLETGKNITNSKEDK